MIIVNHLFHKRYENCLQLNAALCLEISSKSHMVTSNYHLQGFQSNRVTMEKSVIIICSRVDSLTPNTFFCITIMEG
jgi:hypothetical protein